MKILLGLMMLLLLGACGTGNDSTDRYGEPVVEGRVVDRDDSSILVVSGISRDEAEEIDGETILDGGAGAAYWFSGIEDPSVYENGTLVQVWADEIAESYPAQGEAVKIKVIEE
ncbi:DUF3221 domain-containing protein [Alteribacter natronophilus]|uniref:DUF3221 domain-containing protein n=1 Tax=Alteribacter natronophilus TaxID=2583810 RepID=UPI00110D94F5|nr:DUF3221 domain-containing protein [Alteribacter natronophilus]TMW70659.1 DUF3221 domain-containing protein [Alteribacter natronophilus]